MRIIKETHIKFMSQRRAGFILSLFLIIVGTGSLVMNGGPKLSIDFQGGTLIAVQFSQPMEISQIRSALDAVPIDGTVFNLSKEEMKHFGEKTNVAIRLTPQENEGEQFTQSVITHLSDSFPNLVPEESNDFILTIEKVGPKIGAELSGKAVMAVVSALLLILLYISIRFEFIFALGAIVALLHDVLITLGIFSILDYEISLPIIAAFLTIVGYSLNDTIIIFDRIRENIKSNKRADYIDIVDKSINQSISRTLITSLTTFLVVFILWVFGGEVIHLFAFAMMVGVIIGTYSSIYIASPFVVLLHSRSQNK
ncbi:MAG: protein translocase subunit SecF [Candidatus Marinimicrobia bacterium]|jgi:preprotein translocase subunit SecF|nr:protein translocase subunit SecF [Candidatus Neomarinimicrobiota bacterium]